MSDRQKVQDWLDRCYIAIERDRDIRLEQALQQNPKGQAPTELPPLEELEGLDGADLRALARERLAEIYGGWPPETEKILPLPKTRKHDPLSKRMYNAVWQHNRKMEARGNG